MRGHTRAQPVRPVNDGVKRRERMQEALACPTAHQLHVIVAKNCCHLAIRSRAAAHRIRSSNLISAG